MPALSQQNWNSSWMERLNSVTEFSPKNKGHSHSWLFEGKDGGKKSEVKEVPFSGCTDVREKDKQKRANDTLASVNGGMKITGMGRGRRVDGKKGSDGMGRRMDAKIYSGSEMKDIISTNVGTAHRLYTNYGRINGNTDGREECNVETSKAKVQRSTWNPLLE